MVVDGSALHDDDDLNSCGPLFDSDGAGCATRGIILATVVGWGMGGRGVRYV